MTQQADIMAQGAKKTRRLCARHFLMFLGLVLAVSLTACLPSGGRERKKPDDLVLFSEAQKAFDARDYDGAIDLFELFIGRFPRSEMYTWALQRLGESLEGVLEHEYAEPVRTGTRESAARRAFLESFGHHDCWREDGLALEYDGSHYRTIIEEHPDSPIADEAEYRLISWVEDYRGRPELVQQELKSLEQVLEKYPTTSLRYEILYKMAHRCHVLYELYALSPRSGIRDSERAERYRNKALYAYRLALSSPRHTLYTGRAWEGMRALEENRRIYLSP
jgi:tetratricopeptide (TPR) repeat protein